MKRVYVNEKWCLACHLCEYYCAYANSGIDNMVKALKGVQINPRIRIEEKDNISFAVSCRHCEEPLCVKSCLTGALTIKNSVIEIDQDKCVSCYTCIVLPLRRDNAFKHRSHTEMRALHRQFFRRARMRKRLSE